MGEKESGEKDEEVGLLKAMPSGSKSMGNAGEAAMAVEVAVDADSEVSIIV